MKQNCHLHLNPFNIFNAPPKKLSGSENCKRILKREQLLQKSGKHFAEFFKTAQNIDSASASGSESVSESVSVEVSCAESDSHSKFETENKIEQCSTSAVVR
jgi:hypothetical protein